MSKKTRVQKGFTLIEIIIYIALFCILIGGTVSSLYNLSEGAERSGTNALISEEGTYLLNKLEWIISQADAIGVPAENSSSTTFAGITDAVNTGVSLTADRMHIHRGSITEPLSGNAVQASSLIFSRTTVNGKIMINYNFILSARTPRGATVLEKFSGFTRK